MLSRILDVFRQCRSGGGTTVRKADFLLQLKQKSALFSDFHKIGIITQADKLFAPVWAEILPPTAALEADRLKWSDVCDIIKFRCDVYREIVRTGMAPGGGLGGGGKAVLLCDPDLNICFTAWEERGTRSMDRVSLFSLGREGSCFVKTSGGGMWGIVVQGGDKGRRVSILPGGTHVLYPDHIDGTSSRIKKTSGRGADCRRQQGGQFRFFGPRYLARDQSNREGAGDLGGE